jgi:hypothetical protein
MHDHDAERKSSDGFHDRDASKYCSILASIAARSWQVLLDRVLIPGADSAHSQAANDRRSWRWPCSHVGPAVGGVTTIELHLEDLLDAARRGTLSAAAVGELRGHLGRCAACRMTLTLSDDLRAEAVVTNADDALLARLVRGVLEGEPSAAPRGAVVTPSPPPKTK